MRALIRFAMYGAVAAATASTLSAATIAIAQTKHHDAAVTADAPPSTGEGSLVETYTYPNADQILAEKRVKLISGDGHILLVDCSTPAEGSLGLIKVRTTTSGLGVICFKAYGTTGLLNLEVPAVYEIHGDGLTAGAGHNITAIITTAEGQQPPIAVSPTGSTGVGIGDPDSNVEATLLQLKVTP